VQDFARTAASLVQIVLLLVPVTALLIGVVALAPDRGAAELLYSQPIRRRTILLGRLGGLLAALVAAQAVGFGAAGLVVFWHSGGEGLGSFALLVLCSFALTAVFLGGAAWLAVGATAGRRSRAIAQALVAWFAAAVLYDVAALGLASLLRSGAASRLLVAAVILNPVDAVRTAALLGVEGAAAFGAASLAFFRVTGGRASAGAMLGASAIVWIVFPTVMAVRRLRRQDI
jgi:Cu-processing system permease protein